MCHKQRISLRNYDSNYYKNEFLQNKLCVERKEERWGTKRGFFCVKLVGSTPLSDKQSPTEESSTGRIQTTFFKSLLENISYWKLCLFRLTTWYCPYTLLTKIIVIPANINKFKQAKDLKNPVWITVSEALHQPSANFTHHKPWKSLSSTSPSIRQPPRTRGWP